jgi:hypothetical protein
MSAPPPRTRGGVSAVSTADGRAAAQGMIAPMNPFVDASGSLTPVSFRFLYSLFSHINQLLGTPMQADDPVARQRIGELEARLAALEARLPP